MPTYHIKLRKFETDVFVPKEVRGLRDVADYITRDLADKFGKAKALTGPDIEERRAAISQNWYDAHLDVITQLLIDMRDKLRGRHGRI